MSDLFSLPMEPTVTLRPGVEVSLEVLQFGWGLEARGISMRVDDHGDLLVRPRHLLSADDVMRLRQHASDLKRLLRHCAEVTA